MKKQLLLFLFMLLPMVASADSVEIDGIYYNLITEGNVAEVTQNPNNYSGSVVIPETVTYNETTYSVTSIGNYAFRDCTGLTSITIPNSVTSIGREAFKGCSGLASVHNTDIEAWCNINFTSYSSNPLSYAHKLYLNNVEVKDLVIPNSVTSIGNYAFQGCSGLTSITIPNSVTSIGECAFYYCSGLTSVTIPNSVTSIENSAFYYCSGLTSVTIPNSVTSIGDGAFYYCSSLTSVTIPNSITRINSYAFTGCSGLNVINIPNSVISINSYAFANCSGLTSISIPNNVILIGDGVFKNCSGLSSITIPNNVIYIGLGAFAECTGLTSVTIPNSVTSIDYSTFENCSGLTSVTIPNSVTKIRDTAFSGCTQLKDVYCLAVDVPSTSSNAFNGSNIEYATLHVPEASINAYKSTEPWSSFKKIVSVTDNETYYKMTINVNNAHGAVTYNGTNVSNGSQEFDVKEGSDVVLTLTPEDRYQIGSVTVNNVDKTAEVSEGQLTISNVTVNLEVNVVFKSVESPLSRLVEIDGIAYNLNSETNEAEVTVKYNQRGFQEFYSGDIVIPETVTYDGVLYNVTSIGESAFIRSGLNSITIPKSVVSIKKSFFDCILTSVYITDIAAWCNIYFGDNDADFLSSPLYYASKLFVNNEEVKDLVIPNSVKSIGNCAFAGYSNLRSVTISNGVKSIGTYAFSGCKNLISVSLDNSVTSIGNWAFFDCSSLRSIDPLKGVTSIGNASFARCSNLLSITFGPDIRNIDYAAFGDCSNLIDVYCFAEKVPIANDYAFDHSYVGKITLHVPKNSVSTYSNTTGIWRHFKEIVKIGKPDHTLTYMVDGEVYKTYVIEEEEAITPEPIPTKEGYTFSGWSEIPQTMPNHDVTVTGTFNINKYILTYMVDGEVYKAISYDYNEAITPEPSPEREGYTFSGWSEIPQTMPAEDVTVTGTFTINKYMLTYMVDGEEYKSFEVEYGASITPENEPTKEGYTFSGWSEIPETMPAEDVIIIGTFTKAEQEITENGITIIVKIDGTVVLSGCSNASGKFVIPEVMIHNGKGYEISMIGENAFRENNALTEVVIPNTIKAIEQFAFEGCANLREIILGRGLTSIGAKAFANIWKGSLAGRRAGGDGLHVECNATSVPEAALDAFDGNDLSSATLLVDDALVNEYKTTAPWNQFGTIKGFNEATGITIPMSGNQSQDARVFSLDGKQQNALQKGVNIVRMSNGETKKVVVK